MARALESAGFCVVAVEDAMAGFTALELLFGEAVEDGAVQPADAGDTSRRTGSVLEMRFRHTREVEDDVGSPIGELSESRLAAFQSLDEMVGATHEDLDYDHADGSS